MILQDCRDHDLVGVGHVEVHERVVDLDLRRLAGDLQTRGGPKGTEFLHERRCLFGAGSHVLDFYLGILEEGGELLDDGFELSFFGPGSRPMVELLEEFLEFLWFGASVGVRLVASLGSC